MTITEFLLARIAEDEEHARGVKDTYGFTPRRLVAEYVAKRCIVLIKDFAAMDLLASVYADHPDYRREWTS